MNAPGTGPDPHAAIPLPAIPQIGFLAPLAKDRANLSIGDYTYYDDPDGPERFFDRNVRYHFDFIGDVLRIGPFCAIGRDAQFIMNGAAHAMEGFSTYPFNIFGNGWEDGFDPATWAAGNRGDTTIAADVWIGTEAMILPGVTIGPGAIIGARSVVTQDVPAYAIVGGNPARLIRHRFDAATIAALLEICWWDWPIGRISRNLNAIRSADLTALRTAE